MVCGGNAVDDGGNLIVRKIGCKLRKLVVMDMVEKFKVEDHLN